MKKDYDPSCDPPLCSLTSIKFEDRMNRLMLAAGVKNDSELARALGITPQSIGPARKKFQVPSSWVERIAESTGYSSDWIYFGRGNMKPQDTSLAGSLSGGASGTSQCERCAKLEAKLERLDEERRDLAVENRKLWKENSECREKLARLEEAQKPLNHHNSAVKTGAA